MWREWMIFDGVLDMAALNAAYAANIGEDGAKYVENESEFQEAINDGWIVYRGGKTIIMSEGV